MRLLIFLLTSVSALALPPFEDARDVLGSQKAADREALTLEIWKSGRKAIPLLSKLAELQDPEIAIRAKFVLQRLRMGLRPDSPADLLLLASATHDAEPEFRATKLGELLNHPEGVEVALVFLDTWASDPGMPLEHVFKLANVVSTSIVERRAAWKQFLSTPLSAKCRGALIAALSWEDLPMKSQMVVRLALHQTRQVWEMAASCPDQIAVEGYLDMAKAATIKGELPLALEILAAGLDQDTSPDLARNIAFLETGGKLPAIRYEGNWLTELEIFRARAKRNFETSLRLTANAKISPFLAYENHLISGSLTLPSTSKDITIPAADALSAVHQFFAAPPGQPDIEALTSSVLIDWSELARSLLMLTQPVEAAERLASEGQITTALGVYWRTGHQKKARDLADEFLKREDDRHHTRIRLTMVSLHLATGDLASAKPYFEPLIVSGIEQDRYLKSALKMGLQIFPRAELFPLASGLLEDPAFKRVASITGLLDFPPKVATYWYEHFRKRDEAQPPSIILKQVEKFLTHEKDEAAQIIEKEIKESAKSRLLASDSLYQLSLFHRLPSTLAMVTEAAWYQLSATDLLTIIQDESWPMKTRQEALQAALQIDPGNPTLHWLDQKLNQSNSPVALHLHTLGIPNQIIQLAQLTGKRETLKLACELADTRDASSLRCLDILAKSYLLNKQPEEAVRLLQVSMLGEIAAGTQPATGIQPTLENLATYLQARKELATTPDEAEVWQERLDQIGRE